MIDYAVNRLLGWMAEPSLNPELAETLELAYRRIVELEEALAEETLADAWDEGYAMGVEDELFDEDPTPNPYRKAKS